MIYRLYLFYLIFSCILASKKLKPKQCLRYRENDIFLDTCPAYFQDKVDFFAALFPDPVVLSDLSNSGHIAPTKSMQTPSRYSAIPSQKKVARNVHAKPLMSFEEWQKKINQKENEKDHNRYKRNTKAEERQQMVDSIDGGFSDDFGAMLEGFMGSSKKSPNVYTEGEYISPSQSGKSGNRKPFAEVRAKSLKERFNFASIDCAATVRKANPEAKGAQSILYESKDQYLLNKCSANKFVVLNLCEQIVVDTIVMANFEFFSSTFKDFRVYASSKYPSSDWNLLGQWQARNTRDLQVFKVPDSGFVEYLKIELLTHYGYEYYCPLSLVRVHGMTNMEYYTIVESQDQDSSLKNEHLWTEEVREHIIQPELNIVNDSELFYINQDADDKDTKPVMSPITSSPRPTFSVPDIHLDFLKDTPTMKSYIKEEDPNALVWDTHQEELETRFFSTEDIEIDDLISQPQSSMIDPTDHVLHTEIPENDDPLTISASLSDFVTSLGQTLLETPTDSAESNETTLNVKIADENQNTTSTILTSSTTIQKLNPHTKDGSTQESIYKTIMKRLTVLEQNMKLSQRFLDDQNKILNDVFLDMERKHQDQLIVLIGHLNETASQKIDHMKRKYEQWYEDLKDQTEAEMRDMAAKLNILADQLSFERHVSVTQLVIMIVLFVFMALSRGTFNALSPVVAAQQQERKRRESLSSKTKLALDTLIENNKRFKIQKKNYIGEPIVPNAIDEVSLKLKEKVPKKPPNPRRHSDSPYHTMKDIDMELRPSSTEENGKPKISQGNSGQGDESEKKTPSKQLSRNGGNKSIRPIDSLQADLLHKKLDALMIEQRRQELQNSSIKPGSISLNSSLENLHNSHRASM